MKKITLILGLVIISTGVRAQLDSSIKKKIPVGAWTVLYGHDTRKLEGSSIYWGSTTNVAYECYDSLVEGALLKADRENWTEGKRKLVLKEYADKCKGGMLHLYITRANDVSANLKHFTVIVKDSTDKKELFRKELGSLMPGYSSLSDNYWNYTSIEIPQEIEEKKIYLYVIDPINPKNTRTKFEVIIN